MHAAVHLHNEPNRRREEVSDVASSKHHLPLESRAQRVAAQRLPQRLLRRSRRMQHAASAAGEKVGIRSVSTVQDKLSSVA